MKHLKTIVALSTPLMKSAIHLIRLSGHDAYEIINKITDKTITKKTHTIQYTNIVDENNKKVDDVLIFKFVAPKSYTGEDMIEISCHGSIFIVKKIIDLLITNGAVLAQKGEFTQRAYLNQKINLLEAESINNIINANSETGLKIARNPIDNKLAQKLEKIADDLFQIIGQIEVNIDYPEFDDLPDIKNQTIISKLITASKWLKKLTANTLKVLPLMHGINVAIVGKPNVGKSSLLNALLNQDKAIVSEISGTTRDTLEYEVEINGLTYNLIDTAGIHKTNNKIEKIGINKAKENIDKSQIVLFLVDNSKSIDKNDEDIYQLVKDKKHIIVLNKADLKAKQKRFKGIEISAKNKNIKALLEAINSLNSNLSIDNIDLLPSDNDVKIINHCVDLLNLVISELKKNQPIDLFITFLHQVLDNINDLLGKSEHYDFIDELFKNFCVGK